MLPSPFPDNGVEIGGTHWFGERVQLDYAVYATSGFRAPTGSNDLTWGLSQTRGGNMIDNNGVPAGGGRVVTTFRVGEGNDVTVGGSVMYGTWDPANRFSYLIAGGDAAARIGRTQVRFEYLVRRQTFAPDPAVPYKLVVPASGEDTFEKHGAYLEVERSMTETVTLLAARRRALPRRQPARRQPARAARRRVSLHRRRNGRDRARVPHQGVRRAVGVLERRPRSPGSGSRVPPRGGRNVLELGDRPPQWRGR